MKTATTRGPLARLAALLGALALGAALLTGCGATAAASTAEAAATAAPAATAEASAKPLVILHTNDVHGRDQINTATDETAIGDAEIAAAKQAYAAKGYEVLLFSVGDFAQGTPLVNLSKGATAVDFMNAAGYDAACPGNHEFDWGEDNALSLASACKFPVLAANVTRKADGTLLFGDHTVFDLGPGLKVGVFGLDTPTTSTTTNPNNIKNTAFAAGQALYDAAQKQVDALKAAGCDLIVCLGHLGVDDSAAPNRSYDVIDHVQGIDIFLDGHSHTQITEQRGGTLLQSTGSYSQTLGEVTWDGGKATGRLLTPAELTYTPETAVADLVDSTAATISEELNTVFAQTSVALNGERDPGVRTMETNLGDFAADATLWAAQQATGQTVDGAIQNGGSIRASIPAGDITLNDIKTVFPFGNTLVTIQVKGSELLEALEAASAATPQAAGGFAQVAGIAYTVNTAVPYAEGDLYPDTTIHAPAQPGSRITITQVGGKAFDPDALYTIATNDFVAAGGDTYYVFRYANATARIDTGVSMEDALSRYIAGALGGTIGQTYAAPQGRITIQ